MSFDGGPNVCREADQIKKSSGDQIRSEGLIRSSEDRGVGYETLSWCETAPPFANSEGPDGLSAADSDI